MKKIYSALCCALLLIMLCVGLVSMFDKDPTYSESERRKLKEFPKITFSSLLDGSLTTSIREYYADTFPGRENLMETNKSLNGFYYFSGLASDDSTSLVLDFSSNAAGGGEALQTDPTGDATEATGGQETPDTPTNAPPPQTEPSVQAEQLGNVILVGDRGMDVPYANGAVIRNYAKAVTGIADLLGNNVKTMNMLVPNAAAFYAHKEYRSGAYSQTDMFQLCKDNLGSNVTYVDAYSVLANHTDEYIYFRTDHHWTHQGAYYAYTALCDTVGFVPENQDKFDTGKWENFVGSMYTYTASYPQSRVLKENPDTIHYWKPYVDCTTYYYSDTKLSDGIQMGTICKIPEDLDNKYLTFMGGDHPITIVETDVNGPVIMVIKESYGNALISWLTSHYSKIILIDPREYFAIRDDLDLKAFAESQGVNQCLIINYPMMINSEAYVGWLNKLAQ